MAERKWLVIDAQDLVLGRVASAVARWLMGKDEVIYTPHVDSGHFVVIINADLVALTGKKEENKMYHHHTGYVGGLKTFTAAELRERKPTELLRRAIKGMLPKNKLQSSMLRRLLIYAGKEHPHQAQQPQEMKLA
jgi:large subunit ribosomal protein L13